MCLYLSCVQINGAYVKSKFLLFVGNDYQEEESMYSSEVALGREGCTLAENPSFTLGRGQVWFII